MTFRRVAVLAGALLAAAVPSAAAADDCPNAAFRGSAGAALPECRAWEQVSPVDKQGTNVYASESVIGAPEGGSAEFKAPGAFAGNGSSPYFNRYVSRRSDGGWTTRGVDPPQRPLDNGLLNQVTLAISSDQTKALVGSLFALAPGAVDGDDNLYVRDTRTGAYTTIATSPDHRFSAGWRGISGGSATFYDGTPDFAHVLTTTVVPLAPGGTDTDPSYGNLSEWDGSGIRTVFTEPFGSPIPNAQSGRRVSDDGRRIYYQNRTATQLDRSVIYLRQDDGPAVEISASQRPVGTTDPPSSQVAQFFTTSRDGRYAFFRSAQRLTAASDTPADVETLYRYDADTGRLLDLTAGIRAEGANVTSVRGVSDDGSTAYFDATGALAPGATEGETNVYRWHAGDVELVAGGVTSGSVDTTGSAVSPDGRQFVITTNARLTAFDPSSAACPANFSTRHRDACFETYQFTAGRAGVRCLSCPPVGTLATGDARAGIVTLYFKVADPPRAVLDDGRAFFDSPEPLVPGDDNGRSDVYESMPDGTLRLLTSGHARSDAVFGDASVDGRDVLFTTNEQLVPQDDDELIDVYDARSGGGLAAQHRTTTGSSCVGGACRAPVPGAPARPETGTAAGGSAAAGSTDPGDATPTKRAAPVDLRVMRLSSRARSALARTGRGSLRIAVGAAGRLTLTGTATVAGRRRTVLTARATARRRATVRVPLRLSPAARSTLRRRHRLRITLTIRLSSATEWRTLTLNLRVPTPRSRS